MIGPIGPAPAQAGPFDDVARDGIGDRGCGLCGKVEITARQGGKGKAQRLCLLVGTGRERREHENKAKQEMSHHSVSYRVSAPRIGPAAEGATHELGIPARHR
ncbi:hypothetical protein MACH21_31160 [Roseicyclus marinus]|uniref:Uncharacterized protein n=1 Tax=Roseicyclus marinus TaxID=2161673 RepID=A0AA48KK85_9RHOB|nr:hypothetical protein MACH21_31160 [Roseicyclus marinus]